MRLLFDGEIAGIWQETETAVAGAYRDFVRFAIEAIPALIVALVSVLLVRFVRARLSRLLVRSGTDPHVAAIARTAMAAVVYGIAATLIVSLLGGSWTAFVAAFSAGAVVL